MTVALIDPCGFHHTVLIDGDGVHGAENLAHHMEPPGRRMQCIEDIIGAVIRGDAELPHGLRRIE